MGMGFPIFPLLVFIWSICPVQANLFSDHPFPFSILLFCYNLLLCVKKRREINERTNKFPHDDGDTLKEWKLKFSNLSSKI